MLGAGLKAIVALVVETTLAYCIFSKHIKLESFHIIARLSNLVVFLLVVQSWMIVASLIFCACVYRSRNSCDIPKKHYAITDNIDNTGTLLMSELSCKDCEVRML